MRDYGVWALPKGKLAHGETYIEAARREVLEETGYEVSIHEFLGTLGYDTGGRPKIVQFWRMQPSSDKPVRELMRDVTAVKWMPLDAALESLTHPREREFLRIVGPLAIAASKSSPRVTRPSGAAEPPAAVESVEDIAPDAPAAPIAREPMPSSVGSRRFSLIAMVRDWLRRHSSRQND